jgi:hypothetical protein
MSDQKIRLLSWNSDGVRSKIHELLDLAVSTLSIDIIGLCETRLTEKISMLTAGYHCYRQDKHHSGRGQGVAILVKEDIPHNLLKIPYTKNIEAVGVSVRVRNAEYIIISAYQSPNLPLDCNDLNMLFNLGKCVLVMGDFNANHPCWYSTYVNTRGRTLFHHMLEHDYMIYSSTVPTQINYRHDLTATNPDLVLCNNIPCLGIIKALPVLSSNHLPLFFDLQCSVKRNAMPMVFKFSSANWQGYRSSLNSGITLNSQVFKNESQIDAAVDHLNDCIIKARNLNIPLATPQTLNSKLPRYIKKIIRQRNKLRRLDQKLHGGNAKREIRTQINKLQQAIQVATQKHVDKIWNNKLAKVDNPSNDIWRVIKSLKPTCNNIPPLKQDDGNVTSNTSEQCEALATCFKGNMRLTVDWKSPYLKEVKKSISDLNGYTISKLCNPVRPHEVSKALRKFKLRKAPGMDGLQNILLKNLSQKAIVYVTKIFNGCLYTGYFPKSWKTAKVIALKKPGKDDTVPVNYRPISLLPALGKLFERIVASRLHFYSKDKIINEQFGFRSQHSTSLQITRIIEHIAHKLNLNQSTGMFLLDIEKAFDSVWHNGLIHKLISFGIPLHLVKIIHSYLSERSFAVHIGNTVSSPCSIPAGVPQGSILGPILFVLYVNDIPIQTRTNLACFADDTASYTSSNDIDLIVSRLQLSIERLHEYFTNWKLKLNNDKTEAILFTRKRKCPPRLLNIAGHSISWSKSVRYLGVTMDSKINWTKHIGNLRVKGAQVLGALHPVMNRRSNLGPLTKLRIYTTLVRPCLTYACPAWNSTCKSNYKILQSIQNKAVKIAFNTPFRTNLVKLHKTIGLPLIRTYIIKMSCKYLINSKHRNHSNSLISSIGQLHVGCLPYIDRYGTYRLPHHYVLFPPDDCSCDNDIALNRVPSITRPPVVASTGAPARNAPLQQMPVQLN